MHYLSLSSGTWNSCVRSDSSISHHAPFDMTGAYLDGAEPAPPPKLSKGLIQILRLQLAKFNFGWGSATDPAGGAYSAPQNWTKGPTFKGRGGEERRGEERERDGKGRRGRKGHWTHLSLLN